MSHATRRQAFRAAPRPPLSNLPTTRPNPTGNIHAQRVSRQVHAIKADDLWTTRRSSPPGPRVHLVLCGNPHEELIPSRTRWIIIGRLSQSDLFAHEFRTARPPRPVYCHQEFLDKLALRRNESVGKRAAHLLQRMAVDLARLHYKPTSGVNRGWRRSRLGGTAGSHFYAWWAPSGAAPVRNTSFQAGPEAVFLRDIRHHDDHAPLDAGSLSKDYLPMSVSDLRGDEYAPEPWTASQARFARSRGDARILKGHPGSGKTTALLHAADESQAERVLYLTFSADLAALARDYFDRFCSGARIFTVLTYPVWIAQLTGRRGNEPDLAAARA
jgi:hypothetical protein